MRTEVKPPILDNGESKMDARNQSNQSPSSNPAILQVLQNLTVVVQQLNKQVASLEQRLATQIPLQARFIPVEEDVDADQPEAVAEQEGQARFIPVEEDVDADQPGAAAVKQEEQARFVPIGEDVDAEQPGAAAAEQKDQPRFVPIGEKDVAPVPKARNVGKSFESFHLEPNDPKRENVAQSNSQDVAPYRHPFVGLAHNKGFKDKKDTKVIDLKDTKPPRQDSLQQRTTTDSTQQRTPTGQQSGPQQNQTGLWYNLARFGMAMFTGPSPSTIFSKPQQNQQPTQQVQQGQSQQHTQQNDQPQNQQQGAHPPSKGPSSGR